MKGGEKMNIRKIVILCIAVSIIACGVGLGTEKAEAGTYVSLLTTGSHAAWVECVYSDAPVSGFYHYNYTIHLQDFSGNSLSSGYTYYAFLEALKVMNNSKAPVAWVDSPTSPKWNFTQAPDYTYYKWQADAVGDNYFYTSGGQLNDMEIKSKLPPGYVDVAVWNGGTSTSASKTMGPAPEPASMMLLGLGLLGLGGVRFRKRFKA